MSSYKGRRLFALAMAIFLLFVDYSSGVASNDPKFALAIYEGDIAYRKFDNQMALAKYRRVVEIDSSNYEALWKLSRAYIDVGMSLSKKEKMRHYFMADRMAQRCAMLHPDSTEGHFFKAVALGRYALFVGGKRKVQIAREVKMAVERTLQINPNHVGALHVLGRWHHELASLNFFERALAKIIFGGLPSGVSLEKAASYYERAIALNPNSPVHRLDYGRTLFKLGRLREARQQLEICIALPNVFWDDPQNKLEARKLLEKVSNL